VPATWQASNGEHLTGLVPMQTPVAHTSVWVHAFPSVHIVPSDAAGLEQAPLVGSQVPGTWHWSAATHVTGLVPAHIPVWHWSVCVHAFPSLHAVPLAAVGLEHSPVDALHVPATWHWSEAVHVTGLAPVHAPLTHVSVCVHAFPSLHVVPSVSVGFEHCPFDVLHVPAPWH